MTKVFRNKSGFIAMTVFTTVTLLRKQLPANATSPQRHLWQPYARETLRDSSRLRGGLGPALTTKTRRQRMAKFLVAAGCTAVTARWNPSRALPLWSRKLRSAA